MTAIAQAEIKFKFSVAAAAGNTTVGAAATSLGDQISTTEWAGGTLHDLFDIISAAENAALVVDFRCIFVHNTNAANPLEATVVYLNSEVADGANITIAVDNIAASAIGAATPQAAAISPETGVPTGVGAFSAPVTIATGLSLGVIPVGQCRAVWIKRTTVNSAAINADAVTLMVTGETGAA